MGAKNIQLGIGCGVGFGHGFGVGMYPISKLLPRKCTILYVLHSIHRLVPCLYDISS